MCHSRFLSHPFCTINQYQLAFNGIFAVENSNNSFWNGSTWKNVLSKFSWRTTGIPIIIRHRKEKCADVSISPNCDLIYKMQSVVQSRTITTSTPINRTYAFDSDTNLFCFRRDKTKYKRLHTSENEKKMDAQDKNKQWEFCLNIRLGYKFISE